MNIEDVSLATGIDYITVRNHVRSGTLPAQKKGDDWYITPSMCYHWSEYMYARLNRGNYEMYPPCWTAGYLSCFCKELTPTEREMYERIHDELKPFQVPKRENTF